MLFATHYLEEADAVADRIVVLNAGRVVADGTGAEIKARVAGRTIAVAADGLDRARWPGTCPGVVQYRGSRSRLLLHTADSDATLRACSTAARRPADIEVTSARLEDAFLALTANGAMRSRLTMTTTETYPTAPRPALHAAQRGDSPPRT